jgi:hypothetical protein
MVAPTVYRSTSPEYDSLFVKLEATLEKCARVNSDWECDTRCPQFRDCDRWFSGISELSSKKNLTNKQYHAALNRFNRIKPLIFLYPQVYNRDNK